MSRELTGREEELRLAVATAFLEKRGTTILYDFGGDLIDILEDNSGLVMGVLYEYRNRMVDELNARPWVPFVLPERDDD